ncbi:MAG: hypothetical protein KGJ23_08545 [Euryarchaeota archaeon]|nr:hypothetical protein [Euryarchaeota archaeon]MDE1836651.1 hypothetical protein [Euryarchaeota archaeon]MDE1880320.1 hypothetical protein [Euryarchaeota archaeon]MDE2044621.1 hypothetical protein [Thermoplasmata archaeon]
MFASRITFSTFALRCDPLEYSVAWMSQMTGPRFERWKLSPPRSKAFHRSSWMGMKTNGGGFCPGFDRALAMDQYRG